MTVPSVILWRESFGYGSLVWDQVYVRLFDSTNGPYPAIVAGNPGSLVQWGRGSGADQGWAMRGSNGGSMALRASTLGFSGAIDTSVDKLGAAFAYNQGGNLGGSTIYELWDDDGAGNGTFDRGLLHVRVGTLNDGRICVRNGTGSGSLQLGTIIGISTYVLPVGLNGQTGNFTHLEIVPAPGHPLIHSTNGGLRIYADGALVLDLQGVCTRNSLLGSGKVGYAQIVVDGARVATDAIFHDCSGTVLSDGRIGDKRVSYRHALTAGTYTAGTAVGDATLLACVDDVAADGDTTYILEDDTSLPKKVSFVCQAMPSNTISIDEVTELVILRKSDASTNTGRQGLISGGTEVDNGADVAAPTGYNLFTQVGPAPGHQLNPDSGVAFTIPECDACEVVYERVA